MEPMVRSIGQGIEGVEIDSELAERVDEFLDVVRTRDETSDEQPDPVGMLIMVHLELTGFRGVPLLLSWEIHPVASEVRLFEEWFTINPAYQLEATRDVARAPVDLWIPIPREPGPYVIRVLLTEPDGNRLAVMLTDPFD